MHVEIVLESTSSAVQVEDVCTALKGGSEHSRQMEKRILLLREHYEVIVEVVCDMIKRFEMVLKEVSMISEITRQL